MTTGTQDCLRAEDIAGLKADVNMFKRWQTDQNGTLKSLHHGQVLLNGKLDGVAREAREKYQATVEEVDRRVSAKSEALEGKMTALEVNIGKKVDQLLFVFIGMLTALVGVLALQIVILVRGNI